MAFAKWWFSSQFLLPHLLVRISLSGKEKQGPTQQGMVARNHSNSPDILQIIYLIRDFIWKEYIYVCVLYIILLYIYMYSMCIYICMYKT